MTTEEALVVVREWIGDEFDNGNNEGWKEAVEAFALLSAEVTKPADDWKAIEDWRATTSHEATLNACVDEGQWRLTLINWGPKSEQRCEFEGSRETVVEQGAKWCEANLRRAHDEQVESNLALLEQMRADREAVDAQSANSDVTKS